jgi:hypothetical protein
MILVMQPHQYLSPEWLEAVRGLREQYRATKGPDEPLLVNYTITDVPFIDGESASFHLDVRSPLFYEPGHVDEPDLSIVTDYETARTAYRDSSWNLDSIRKGYASGRLQVEGDLDRIPEWWVEVVQDPEHIAVWDQIMMVTA